MKKVSLWAVLLAVLLFGCASYYAYYKIGLDEVERPAQARERYGEQKITQIKEEGIEKFYFEDDMVEIIWIPTESRISFSLTNKTNHSIKIVWDEAAYVDVNGESRRIMHSGVKYIDRNSPQPPSVIVRKGKLTDFVIPTDYAYFKSGRYGGWETQPLFPNKALDAGQLIKEATAYKGKTVQVLLPLKIEDVLNDYIFTFKINDVNIMKVTADTTKAGDVLVMPGKIGIFFQNQIVTGVIPSGPADQAGVRAGDKIITANGVALNGNGLYDTALIIGAPGTTVILRILRGKQELEISVVRAQ